MKRIFIFVLFVSGLLLAFFLFYTDGRTAYVSPMGNDEHPGTITRPVKTIQQGVRLMQRGGTVKILPGIYRETVTISGSFSSPLRLQAMHANGGTAIIAGSEPSSALSWNSCTDDSCPAIQKAARSRVYAAYLPWDEAPTLLTEETAYGIKQQLPLARSPNEEIKNPDKFHEFWWQASTGSQDASTLFDPPHLKTVPQLNGGRAFIIDGADRCGTYMYVLPIKNHDRTAGSFHTGADIGAVTYGIQENGISQFTKYYVDGAIGLLDAPGEWFYDKSTHMLYLWPRVDKNPGDMPIEIARRQTGISINRSRVTIDGISIQNINDHEYSAHPAGAVIITPVKAIRSIRLSNILSTHAGHGIFAQPSDNGQIQTLVITGARMEHISKSAVTVAGSENGIQNVRGVRIDGSVISQSGFPFGEAAVSVSRASHVRIVDNDIRDIASYGIHLAGFEKNPQAARNILVAGNTVEHACQNSSGCAALKAFGGNFANTFITANTLRSTLGWSFCVEATQNRSGDGMGLFISNASGITVSSNLSADHGGAAYIAYTRQIPATHNVFYKNIAAGSDTGIALEHAGNEKDADPAAYASRHRYTVIARNILQDNRVALSVDPAIPESLVIKGNTYKDNGTALLFRGVSVDNPSDISRKYSFWEP